MMKITYRIVVVTFLMSQIIVAQNKNKVLNVDQAKEEAKYYKIEDITIPKGVVLEVGGLALNDKDQLGVSTRRGEVWLVSDYSKSPKFNRYAHGLHEALGLAFKDKSFYVAQRGELTRLDDKDNNGVADTYKTIATWPLSGNYHEYTFGPKIDKNGNFILTFNTAHFEGMSSLSKWRGWLIKIDPKGNLKPIAAGLRSPAGFGINENNDIFYTDNQGEWVGSGRMTHLEEGDFAGHIASLRWTDEPESPLKLKEADITPEPEMTMFDYAKKIKPLKLPAIWFPHTILGISTSDILYDNTKGNFGPFDGQQFVGDQGHSKVIRVFMEKINGVYQGATFPFVEGFSSGVLRMIWGSDNNMIVGMTSRGWSSTGPKNFALQRLVWTGKTPFEIKTMKAHNDGFELEFTKPINKKQGADVGSYNMSTFNYLYHDTYGSPVVNRQNAMIHKAEVSDDGLRVKLTVHGMRLGYIHQIEIPELKSTSGENLLHDTGYYTLNEVPGGELKSPQMQMSSDSEKVIEQPKRVTKIPASWNNSADEKIVLGTIPGLKYDKEEVSVKRNSKIELILNNNDDMIHNVVVTKQGDETPVKVGEMALTLGLDGPAMNYVPFTDLVLAHSGTVGPEASETIYFISPKEPGTYWLVCTFPGHAYTMRTKLIVK